MKDLAEQKSEMRRKILIKRENLSVEYKKKADLDIFKALKTSKEFVEADSIFTYVSVENEPDTRKLMELSIKLGKKLYVPRCISIGVMELVEIKNPSEELEQGYFGLYEPKRNIEGISCNDIKNLSLAVVPCVTCGYDFSRLGHGGGFYDIFFERVKTKKIALCYEELMVERVPMGYRDVFMDDVITEQGQLSMTK